MPKPQPLKGFLLFLSSSPFPSFVLDCGSFHPLFMIPLYETKIKGTLKTGAYFANAKAAKTPTMTIALSPKTVISAKIFSVFFFIAVYLLCLDCGPFHPLFMIPLYETKIKGTLKTEDCFEGINPAVNSPPGFICLERAQTLDIAQGICY